MIRAVLVDDEPIILNSLRENYNWTDLGIEIVGISEDGDEAFDLICDLNPDLIITDIKMPTLSGIELVKLLHKANIYPKVIFATGHSDFEYTREAIRLGAFDYILKPFSPDELTDTVLKCVDDIHSNQEKMHNKEREQTEFKLMNYFSITSNALRRTHRNVVNTYIEEHFDISVVALNYLTTTLTPETSPTNVDYNECIQLIRRLNFNLGWEKYFIFALPESHNILIVNYRTNANVTPISFERTNTNYMSTLQESLFENLAVDSTIHSNNPVALNTMFDVEMIFEQYTKTLNPSLEINTNLTTLDVAQTQKYMHDALTYIHNRYGTQLKLQEVADSVYLSESHFSALFAKSMGLSFSKYLAKYRVDMAKLFMQKNRYAKIYEVSNHVGYTDARYFSTLFKKTEGITPSEYVKQLF